ncbi:uncharacterized protein LOC144870319 [Branchiostoma floridae x Branchiostoma japonicum]
MQLFFTASLFVMLGLLAHGSSGAPTALRSSANDDAADDGELLSQLRTIMEKEQSDEGNGDEDNADPGDVYAASQTEKRGSKKKFGKGGKIVGNIIGGLLNGVLGGMGGSEKKRQTYGANGDEDDFEGPGVEDVEDLLVGLELVEELNSLEEEECDGGNADEDIADLRGENAASQTEKRGFRGKIIKCRFPKVAGRGDLFAGILGGMGGSEEKRQTYEGNGDEDNADPGDVYAASQTEKRGFKKKIKFGKVGKKLSKVGKNLSKVAGGLLAGFLGSMGGSEEKRQTYEANGDEDDVQGLSVEDVEDLVLGLELVEALNSLKEEDSDGGNGDEDNADLVEENAASQTEKRGFGKNLKIGGKIGGKILEGVLDGILGR